MEEHEVFDQFKVKKIDGIYWIITNSDKRPNMDLKLAIIADHIREPRAVATAIAESLKGNNKLKLIDLI